jgi:hypothetical protein
VQCFHSRNKVFYLFQSNKNMKAEYSRSLPGECVGYSIAAIFGDVLVRCAGRYWLVLSSDGSAGIPHEVREAGCSGILALIVQGVAVSRLVVVPIVDISGHVRVSLATG